MALTPVEQVNLLIANTVSNPFYPIFSNVEIQQFLDFNNQNVYAAARMAAIAASMTIAGYSSREVTGDLEIWNDYAKNYLAALNNFIKNPAFIIPPGLFPWSANTCPSKLMNIEVCDGDACKEAACCTATSGTGCSCISCGDTFVY